MSCFMLRGKISLGLKGVGHSWLQCGNCLAGLGFGSLGPSVERLKGFGDRRYGYDGDKAGLVLKLELREEASSSLESAGLRSSKGC